MATAWKVAAATAVLSWLVTPVIAFFLPKIITSLGFDTEKKLRDLQTHIMPELQKTLREVDQARMLRDADRAREEVSDVITLNEMAAWLRHAREDAEDIVDDHLEIQRYGAVKACLGIVRSGWARLLQWTQKNSCLRRLYGAVDACIARCLGIARIVRSRSAQLLQWKRSRSAQLLQWKRNWFEEPVQVNASASASHNHVGVTMDIEAPQEEAVSEATPSDSAPVLVTTPSCSSFDVFKIKSLCISISYWLRVAFVFARFCRNWSYRVVGITNQEENANALDFMLTAISRWNLKKRIEKIESTISEVKSSPLVGAKSKNAPDIIANNNRSKIRTASNRKVFGREAFRDSIMEKLLENSHDTSPCYSVIGIYGVAGSGKTTFARYIRDFIEKECKEKKLFDTIMCIHVSESFSVDDIYHEMLKDINKVRDSNMSDHEELTVKDTAIDRDSNMSDHEGLTEKLKKSLEGKCFFLILDDLWVNSRTDQKLEELISPLNVGLKGSKIMVTARTKVAARALCADEPMEMPYLDEDQYLNMFMHYSLGGTNVVNEEFMRVGRVIAKKLHGSPIAAVVVAGQLGANRDIIFWKKFAKRDMTNGTMGVLWWSYQHLSSDIKRCFEYCNIFPKRFKMKKDNLVNLWIAQGFVKTSGAVDDMEDVAEGYIQELVSCSFLQPEKNWNGEEFYRIHDLLHDLADMVTGTDCFRLENASSKRGENWKGDIPRDVRHLFVENYDAELITDKVLGLGNLRTLIINVVGGDTQVEEKVIDSICKKLLKLRVLAFALSDTHYPTQVQRKFLVPESTGQLKHLRYFAFRTSNCMITLPRTVNNLQHIQLLDFGDCDISEFTFAEHVNLRQILCCEFMETFRYVGRLSSLQTLSSFNVRNEQGFELKQLRDLNKLRGELCISGLANVKSKAQALEANLASKEGLTELTLDWAYDDETRCSREVEADVLEGLCPPAGLKKLVLWNYLGSRYPYWMVGKHNGGQKDLQEIHLSYCSQLGPAFGLAEPSPHLDVLELSNCSQLGPAFGLAEAFPHLHMLELSYCSWDALPENMEHLTSLKKLLIRSCKNIRSLPSLPQSLEEFTLSGCNYGFTESCETVGNPNWEKIEHIARKHIHRPLRLTYEERRRRREHGHAGIRGLFRNSSGLFAGGDFLSEPPWAAGAPPSPAA
ncbi:unnamed protein product [Alopecurus aequalis]